MRCNIQTSHYLVRLMLCCYKSILSSVLLRAWTSSLGATSKESRARWLIFKQISQKFDQKVSSDRLK